MDEESGGAWGSWGWARVAGKKCNVHKHGGRSVWGSLLQTRGGDNISMKIWGDRHLDSLSCPPIELKYPFSSSAMGTHGRCSNSFRLRLMPSFATTHYCLFFRPKFSFLLLSLFHSNLIPNTLLFLAIHREKKKQWGHYQTPRLHLRDNPNVNSHRAKAPFGP